MTYQLVTMILAVMADVSSNTFLRSWYVLRAMRLTLPNRESALNSISTA